MTEGQPVLVTVAEKMAMCTLTGFSDGAAVLVVGERQRGGPMPEFAPDAQLAFESGPNLVMLNGALERRGDDQLLFMVTDGVQVPPRRRDSRLRTRLPVRLRAPSGSEHDGWTADLSATGFGVEGTDHGREGQEIGIRLALPDGSAVAATTRVVRVAGHVTALRIERFEEGGRDRLGDYVLACARGDAVGSTAPDSSNPS
jgi:hypothetical protein